jgi:hypothetical protein
MASLAAVWGKNRPAAAANGNSRLKREQSIGKHGRKVAGTGGWRDGREDRGRQDKAQAQGCLTEPRDGIGDQIRYLA